MSSTFTEARGVRLAVDIGGTFVDAIELDADGSAVRLEKALATPGEPWVGVLESIAKLGVPLAQVDRFIHGTTMGLNALLERRGAVTGIITNRGFRDVFLIGRANVPDAEMFNFRWEKPKPLVPRRRTVGVPGRLNARGEVVEELDEEAVLAAAEYLIGQGVEAIAICFLHSYRNPEHERRAAAAIAAVHGSLPISVSSDITREYREYERTSTTVIDAYVRPVFGDYLGRLEDAFEASGFTGRFLVMRSGGGAASAEQAKVSPTHTLLSGPAGGIVGAAQLARLLERPELLTFDVGGTSVDACVIEDGNPVTLFGAELEHHPLLIPIYDIRTIGAGGGSIARIDDGLLKVGPRSAGSAPGPVCYGRGGTEPTVTDAAVCLGYIDPERFLGGEMRLDVDGAHAAIERQLGEPMGLDAVNAAACVFDVLAARTVGALRQITVERGRDPKTFSMLAFGGAGPLLGPLLARELGVRELIVPTTPSGFSAWGMLGADLIHDEARSALRLLDDLDAAELDAVFTELERNATNSLRTQAGRDVRLRLDCQLELRYLGQEHSLAVPWSTTTDKAQLREAFDEQHRIRYEHVMPNPVEVLTFRVRATDASATALRPPALAARDDGGDAGAALLCTRKAWCVAQRELREFGVYMRDALRRGDRITGPAIVEEATASTVLFSDQDLAVDEHGHLLITRAEEAR